MPKVAKVPAVMALGLVISVCASAQSIHLKTRNFTPGTQSPATLRNTTAPGTTSSGAGDTNSTRLQARRSGVSIVPIHQIVEFDHTPGINDLNALLVAGAQVTGALPDNAVVVSFRARLNSATTGAIWLGEMEAQDKISPALGFNSTLKAVVNSTVSVIVEFHADVDQTQQTALATALNIIFQRPAGLLPKHVIVQATRAAIELLSAEDEVAYIFPADPALLISANSYPCAGMLTTSGTIGQYANVTHGWDLGPDNIAHLSYYFGSLTPQISAATVQSEILRAFAQWTSHVNVTFSPTAIAGMARTIALEFVSGAHGDSYPFSALSMLAHTFYPVPVNSEPIAGDMHFNADERWHVGSDNDIYTVALHEAGHALGLTHSDNPGDVMYPYYHRGALLSANDIGAALELYPAAGTPPVTIASTGAPVIVVSSTPTTTTTTSGNTGSTTAAPTPVTPIDLTVNPVPSTTQTSTLSVSGSVNGGMGPDSVEWQTDRGYTGNAAISGADLWSAANIPLVTGENTLTFTAFNTSGQVSTQTASITLQKPTSMGSAPLTLSIVSPVLAVSTVTTAEMSVSGTAAGGIGGITQVTWQTSNGATGIACGTNTWIATGIPVPEGNTTIIVRAYDSTGLNAWVATVAVKP